MTFQLVYFINISHEINVYWLKFLRASLVGGDVFVFFVVLHHSVTSNHEQDIYRQSKHNVTMLPLISMLWIF